MAKPMSYMGVPIEWDRPGDGRLVSLENGGWMVVMDHDGEPSLWSLVPEEPRKEDACQHADPEDE